MPLRRAPLCVLAATVACTPGGPLTGDESGAKATESPSGQDNDAGSQTSAKTTKSSESDDASDAGDDGPTGSAGDSSDNDATQSASDDAATSENDDKSSSGVESSDDESSGDDNTTGGDACLGDLILCQERCIDPARDRNFCGAEPPCDTNPGAACGAAERCMDGTCIEGCWPREVLCDGTCIDPEASDEYCGAHGDCSGTGAGERCTDGRRCEAGQCRRAIGHDDDVTIVRHHPSLEYGRPAVVFDIYPDMATVVWKRDGWVRATRSIGGTWEAFEDLAKAKHGSDVRDVQLGMRTTGEIIATWSAGGKHDALTIDWAHIRPRTDATVPWTIPDPPTLTSDRQDFAFLVPRSTSPESAAINALFAVSRSSAGSDWEFNRHFDGGWIPWGTIEGSADIDGWSARESARNLHFAWWRTHPPAGEAALGYVVGETYVFSEPQAVPEGIEGVHHAAVAIAWGGVAAIFWTATCMDPSVGEYCVYAAKNSWDGITFDDTPVTTCTTPCRVIADADSGGDGMLGVEHGAPGAGTMWLDGYTFAMAGEFLAIDDAQRIDRCPGHACAYDFDIHEDMIVVSAQVTGPMGNHTGRMLFHDRVAKEWFWAMDFESEGAPAYASMDDAAQLLVWAQRDDDPDLGRGVALKARRVFVEIEEQR